MPNKPTNEKKNGAKNKKSKTKGKGDKKKKNGNQKKFSKKLRKQAPLWQKRKLASSEGSDRRHFSAHLKLDVEGEKRLLDFLIELRYDPSKQVADDDNDSSSDSESDNSESSSDDEKSIAAANNPIIAREPVALSNHQKINMLHDMMKQDRKASDSISTYQEDPRDRLGGSKPLQGKRGSTPVTAIPLESGSVRVMVCCEKKNGQPNIGDSKLMILPRNTPIPSAIIKAQGKLKVKKKPKGLGLVHEGTISQWLSDLSLVQDDDMLCLSSVGVGKARAIIAQPLSNVEENCDEDAIEMETRTGASVNRLMLSYKAVNAKRFYTHKTMSPDEIEKLSEKMLNYAELLETSERYQKVMKHRQHLPVFSYRDEILSLIELNQVVVIEGETGCGKTTQIPQFILEDAIRASQGGSCSIICTQPRRISAIGVATRVASERCENIGGVVGYRIRLESETSAATRLTFMTTGVLLRRLTTDSLLSNITHVIVDEVHERGLETDFLLIILRDLLSKRPDLKVILMSATMQVSLFTEYFGGCPRICISGRTFPVTTFHLEDLSSRMRKPLRTQFSKPQERNRNGRVDTTKPSLARETITNVAHDVKNEVSLMSSRCQDPVILDDIIEIICHIVQNESQTLMNKKSTSKNDFCGGAILVFLAGAMEIGKLVTMINKEARLNGCCQVFPLHSSLSPEHQRSVFKVMARGIRKIVVSTNIAETSITIEDCMHVIDTGRVKEMRYNAGTSLSSLVEVWTSQASAKQRAGRAGRVRSGTCWRMYPSAFYTDHMTPYTLPELLRSPLEELVLQTLILDIGDPAVVLSKAVQPPPENMLHAALRNLYEIEAVTVDRVTLQPSLTPLGYHLAHLPMDARVGKLLIMGALLKCLDPILTVAASLSSISPFIRPFGSSFEREAMQSKKQYGGNHGSDSIAAVAAYQAWEAECKQNKSSKEWQWCKNNFISGTSMEVISGLREQFRDHLISAGFASVDSTLDNTHAGDKNLLKSVLCAGLYPQVAWYVRPAAKGYSGAGSQRAHFALRDDLEAAFLHPSSVNRDEFQGSEGKAGNIPHYMLYHSRMKTTQVYLHETTQCSPFSLLLWGSHIRHVRHRNKATGNSIRKNEVVIEVDHWLRFKTSERVGVIFKHLRNDINEILLGMIENIDDSQKSDASVLVNVISNLLRMEGSHSFVTS